MLAPALGRPLPGQRSPCARYRCVLTHGTTTALCDPHEICNVLGLAGLRYFLDSALGTAMDLRVQLSSCVPATELETSGARLGAADLVPYRDHPKVIGLAEFMNVPGVLNKDPSASTSWRRSRARISTATRRYCPADL